MKKIKHFLKKFLLWLYQSDRELTPLDLPLQTVKALALTAFLFALCISNLFLPYLYRQAEKQLDRTFIPLHLGEDRGTNKIVSALASEEDALKLPLDWINYTYNEDIQEFATDDQISSKEAAQFLKSLEGSLNYKQLIIGDLKRPFGIAQSISSFPPSEILVGDQFRKPSALKPGRYEIGDNDDPKDNPELNYLIAQSVITKFREQTGKTYTSPRRFMMALAGPIQFITFFLALWGLLTIMLRLLWATVVQTHLIRTGKLWDDEKGSIWSFWKGNPSDHPLLGGLVQRYGFALAPVRLIFDAIKVKMENTHLSADDFVEARIDAMQADVKNNEYHILGWIIFALPQIGLLGTILGIIETMANVPDILKSSGANSMLEAFEKVGGSLALAFDTTFVALFWVLILGYGKAILEKTEGDIFQELKTSSKPYIRQLWKQ